MTEKNLIDPLCFLPSDMPIVILCSDLRALIPSIIKLRTGNFNHVMLMVEPGRVITQNWTLQDLTIQKYMKPGILLQFWGVKGVTYEGMKALYTKAKADVKKPWWRRRYDPLGIVGQALGLPWIQSPWGWYCSERVSEHLSIVKIGLPKHPNPSDFSEIFSRRSKDFALLGWYIGGG